MQEEKIELERSEEVRDIIGIIPGKGARYVLCIVSVLVFLLLLLGYVIKYPVVISGEIRIITQNSPARLVAKTSGKIRLYLSRLGQKVKEGDIIATVGTSTKSENIIFLDSLLKTFSVLDTIGKNIQFPTDLNFGELNSVYYEFIDSYNELKDKYSYKLYLLKEGSLNRKIETCRKSIDLMKNQMEIRQKQLDYLKRELSRDSLSFQLETLSERDIDTRNNQYNQYVESYINLEAAYNSEESTLAELLNQKDQLAVEKNRYLNTLKLHYVNSYNTLVAAVLQWKEQYAFVAPFTGYLEYLGFWQEASFIAAGTEIFSIIPEENPVIGQMQVPTFGAGKIVAGQDVSIKLNDYPYLEYGTLEGKVNSISKVTNKMAIDQNNDMYLLIIDIPKGLVSKFGTDIKFKYEMKGIADIKTAKRRLIERLFDNLKYVSQ